MATQRGLATTLIAVAIGLMSALPCQAQGVDLQYLDYRLSMLPEVTSHAVDDQGHLTSLVGRLTGSLVSSAAC